MQNGGYPPMLPPAGGHYTPYVQIPPSAQSLAPPNRAENMSANSYVFQAYQWLLLQKIKTKIVFVDFKLLLFSKMGDDTMVTELDCTCILTMM